MRFLLAVMAVDGESDATPDEITEINAFNERLNANGQALLAIGLAGPRDAYVVDNRRDAGLITDGPAVTAEEHMAGIWLIEAANMNEALAIATTASKACNRRIEIRAVL
jgi:hypothetical protein